MAGGDVRGFYKALGIALPGWAQTEAPVRCFADPDAHHRQDRNPSCSVNLESGAFNCHGCGARGGAYDAAIARGRAPREAMDLLVASGLAERRGAEAPLRPARTPRPPVRPVARVRLAVTADQLKRWAEELLSLPELTERLWLDRRWSRCTLADLGVGFDGERITVPVWQPALPGAGCATAALQGVLRLRVDGAQHPKVVAAPGTRLGLMPAPEWTRDRRLLLVEGPSDMLAARSAGLPAIAVPGANAWRSEWARSLAGRSVVVVMDCDRVGRQAAGRIAADLDRRGIEVGVVDLAPARADGYDLSDWLREANPAGGLLTPPPARSATRELAASSAPLPGARQPLNLARSIACRTC
jgi:hypothetical protein